jgi:tetratricopeptide (TPR) repeat protein/tRNA A-37 threonylcarbamoyl transferase component Bud32
MPNGRRMTHVQETTLALFVARRLADSERDSVEQHLDSCEACRVLVGVLAAGSNGPSSVPCAETSDRVQRGFDGESPDYAELVEVTDRHYAIAHELARGGMGRVRLARDRRLGRMVAIKEVLVRVGELARRFEREARITARLQHPGIVSVYEAGVWASGMPFYAMPVVRGRSLDEVVAGKPSLEQRMELVPNVLAVADAMAYAHGERVIHRDLKPKNVLVGAFGETVVIDWGLAKDLDANDTEPDVANPTASVSAIETEAGEVMGTPAYMPPEQADGAAVDERADVYAIGALLTHVLTGKPPYEGRTSLEVLGAVRSGPPLPIREREPNVPRDLAAIVDRAMARDPAHRYATARELAEDLRRFQTGQLVGAHQYSAWQLVRRWARRYRAPIGVGVTALVLLAVLGIVSVRGIVHEQARADEQRQLAEASRSQAEDLSSFMLIDLYNRLGPIGRLDLLDAVAKKAVTYYARPTRDTSNAESAKRAVARRNLCDVLLFQGRTDEATVECRAAVELAAQVAALEPEPKRKIELAHCLDHLGQVLRQRGDSSEAVSRYQASHAIYSELAASDPANDETQGELAESYGNLGDMVLETDAAGALAQFRSALTTYRALAAKDPANTTRQRDLVRTHIAVGKALVRLGDTAAAVTELREALAISSKLSAKDPTNADWKRDLANAHEVLGQELLNQGDRAGALAELTPMNQIDRELAANDPTNVGRQRDMWSSDFHLGELYEGSQDTERALAFYRSARDTAARIVALDSTNAARKGDLAKSREKIATLLVARNQRTEALEELRAARALEEALAKADPSNTDMTWLLSLNHHNVADILVADHDTAAALPEYERARDLAADLVARDPTSAQKLELLAGTNGSVGDALLELHDPARALVAYRADLAIAEPQAAKDPTNDDSQLRLVEAHSSIGDALRALRDEPGARHEYETARSLTKRILERDPSNPSAQTLLRELAQDLAKR